MITFMHPENKTSLAPIALFVYRRAEHTKRTVEALAKNALAKESELFVFSDGFKNEDSKEKVLEVRTYLKTITGFKKVEIIEREKNMGLANSIISGVTDMVSQYGRVIVVEDDLVTSPHFLEYMNEALDLYEKEDRVISIHGWIYPVKKRLPDTFFLKGTDCWGWATWKRGWDLFEPDGKKLLAELERKNLIKEFDFEDSYNYSGMLKRQIEGKNDSWAIRWYASAFLKNKLTLYPSRSLVQNIGQDASGTHRGNSTELQTKLFTQKINLAKIEPVEDTKAKAIIIKYLKSLRPNIFKRIINKIIR